MRILIVSSMWPSTDNQIRGVFVEEQAAAISQLGHDVTVVVPKSYRSIRRGSILKSTSEFFLLEVAPYIDIPQKMTPGVLDFGLNAYSCGKALRKHFERLKGARYDVILLHDIRYVAASHFLWSEFVEGNVVLVVHGFDSYLSKYCARRPVAKSMATIWRNMNRIIVVGTPLFAHLRELSAPKKKVVRIANGARFSANILVKQRGLDNTRIILSVSNLVDWKGIDLNLLALAQLAQTQPDIDWRYRVVGDGVLRDRLEKQALFLGVSQKVVFLGRLSREDTLAEFESCDVFSLPSWSEPFGIAYLEAMGCGKPVIGCYGTGAEDFIVTGEHGFLVEKKNVAALSQALARLVGSPELSLEYGANARKLAETMTWHRNAELVLSAAAQ